MLPECCLMILPVLLIFDIPLIGGTCSVSLESSSLIQEEKDESERVHSTQPAIDEGMLLEPQLAINQDLLLGSLVNQSTSTEKGSPPKQVWSMPPRKPKTSRPSKKPSKPTHRPPLSEAKVVILGGGQRVVEILDLDNGEMACDDIFELPHTGEGSCGAVVDEKIVVCGGEDEDYLLAMLQRQQCWYYDKTAYKRCDQWKNHSKMLAFRNLFGCVSTKMGFLAIGGTNGKDRDRGMINASEYINHTSSNWTKIPNSDRDVLSACVVEINGSIIRIGGYLSDGKKFPYIHRLSKSDSYKKWVYSPMLNVSKEFRHMAMCGYDAENDRIVYAGGLGCTSKDCSTGLDPTDELSIKKDTVFLSSNASGGTGRPINGTDLPIPLYGASTFKVNGKITLIGGRTEDMQDNMRAFQFDGEKWQVIDGLVLSYPRFNAIALTVPHNVLKCHKPMEVKKLIVKTIDANKLPMENENVLGGVKLRMLSPRNEVGVSNQEGAWTVENIKEGETVIILAEAKGYISQRTKYNVTKTKEHILFIYMNEQMDAADVSVRIALSWDRYAYDLDLIIQEFETDFETVTCEMTSKLTRYQCGVKWNNKTENISPFQCHQGNRTSPLWSACSEQNSSTKIEYLADNYNFGEKFAEIVSLKERTEKFYVVYVNDKSLDRCAESQNKLCHPDWTYKLYASRAMIRFYDRATSHHIARIEDIHNGKIESSNALSQAMTASLWVVGCFYGMRGVAGKNFVKVNEFKMDKDFSMELFKSLNIQKSIGQYCKSRLKELKIDTQNENRNPNDKKLLVVGGGHGDVELLDLDNGKKNCPAMPKFPNEGVGSCGVVLDGRVVVCGGDEAKNECYMFEPSERKWVIHSKFLKSRPRGLSCGITQLGFTIFGGSEKSNRSEVYLNGKWTDQNIDNDIHHGYGCTVQYLDKNGKTSILSVGGMQATSADEKKFSTAYHNLNMDAEPATWRSTNVRNELLRAWPICGYIEETKQILIAGGLGRWTDNYAEHHDFDKFGGVKEDTYLLDLQGSKPILEMLDHRQNRTRTPYLLPFGLYGASSFILNGKVTAIGGQTADLKHNKVAVQFHGKDWKLLNWLKLQQQRHWPVVLPVDYHVIGC